MSSPKLVTTCQNHIPLNDNKNNLLFQHLLCAKHCSNTFTHTNFTPSILLDLKDYFHPGVNYFMSSFYFYSGIWSPKQMLHKQLERASLLWSQQDERSVQGRRQFKALWGWFSSLCTVYLLFVFIIDKVSCLIYFGLLIFLSIKVIYIPKEDMKNLKN